MSSSYGKKVVAEIEFDMFKLHDGWHTIGELYDHRHFMYGLLVIQYASSSWMTKHMSGGEECEEDWFIMGVELPTGQISYHMPIEMWDSFEELGVRIVEGDSPWDGHDSFDVLDRLEKWFDFQMGINTNEQKRIAFMDTLVAAGLPVDHLVGTITKAEAELNNSRKILEGDLS